MDPSFPYPNMMSCATRLASFDNPTWKSRKLELPSTQKLADAGFFFDQVPDGPDRCVCFSCGLALVNWDPNDNPFADHLKHINREDGDKKYTCFYMNLLRENNPDILGLENNEDMLMSAEDMHELDKDRGEEVAFALKEDLNKRKDFMKALLFSSLFSIRLPKESD